MKYFAGILSEIESRPSTRLLQLEAAQDALFPHSGDVHVSDEFMEFSGFTRFRPRT